MRKLFRGSAVATLTAGVLALAACGSDNSGNDAATTSAADANQNAITQAEATASSEKDVVAAFTEQLNASGTGQQLQFDAPGASEPCPALVLIGADQIATYQGEGGVVTNPAGTVGIQIFEGPPADKPACLKAAAEVLKGL